MKKLFLITLLLMLLVAFTGCEEDEPEQEDPVTNEDEVDSSFFITEYDGRYFAAFSLQQVVTTNEEGKDIVHKNVLVRNEYYMDVEGETIFDEEMKQKEEFAIPIVLEISNPMASLEDILTGREKYLERLAVMHSFGLYYTGDNRALLTNGSDLREIGRFHPSMHLGYPDHYELIQADEYTRLDKSDHYDFSIANDYLEAGRLYTASLAMISLEDNMYISVSEEELEGSYNY